VIFEEYYPLDQVEYSATVNKIMTQQRGRGLQTPSFRRVWGHSSKQLYEAGFGEARRPAVLRLLR